jgi:hypothetical protein
VTEASLDHLASQALGVLADRLAPHERVLVHSIGFDLAPDVLVKKREPVVRHSFDGHWKYLQLEMNYKNLAELSGAALVRPRASQEHRFSKDLLES